LKDYVHIGVAVDTPSGLLVPVLRDADQKDIESLAVELNDLATKARERKLKPEEMEGGCFTVSNLGGVGRDLFTPIVLPPQVAILGVARGRHEPVWNGQDFVPEMILPLTLTYDHRVIDGADGARFMTWICQAIEYPLQLVMKG
ncbi:MAG: branched-chain alpha-keto acid dehydrogenase subunit E2, partial [Desulfuromonadales bacterium]|nr:branched-chain alpha-keto acid dehydrogenase subunit E2 [Desulfuromonadales bacterium]NIS39818.1 branched-chain alpha-keto acid dehydrogenase subunit E2 [Desulfuromonadales bacterium]